MKNKKGSILAYALIVVAIMLSVAASLSTVAVIDKKAASGIQFSVQSLQTADSGSQIAVKKINTEINKPVPGSIATAVGNCSVDSSPNNTDGGPAQSAYTLTFFDKNGVQLLCTDPVTSVASIKSVGTYKNTVRSVSVSVSTDGNDEFVKLLLHNNGSGTIFIDSEATPKTINSVGGATQSTAQYKFSSGSSAFFDGNNDYLSISDSEDFTFGLNESFTIDMWIYPTLTTGNYESILNSYFDSSSGFILTTSNGVNGNLSWYSTSNPGTWYDTGFTLSPNAWQHIAVVRNVSEIKFYVNGEQKGASINDPNPINSGSGKMYVGRNLSASYANYKGYIDELRISKGVARWTEAFTPPTYPY